MRTVQKESLQTKLHISIVEYQQLTCLQKTAGSLHLGACVMVHKLRKCLFQESFVRGLFIGEKNSYSKISFSTTNKICSNVLMHRGRTCAQIRHICCFTKSRDQDSRLELFAPVITEKLDEKYHKAYPFMCAL